MFFVRFRALGHCFCLIDDAKVIYSFLSTKKNNKKITFCLKINTYKQFIYLLPYIYNVFAFSMSAADTTTGTTWTAFWVMI